MFVLLLEEILSFPSVMIEEKVRHLDALSLLHHLLPHALELVQTRPEIGKRAQRLHVPLKLWLGRHEDDGEDQEEDQEEEDEKKSHQSSEINRENGREGQGRRPRLCP